MLPRDSESDVIRVMEGAREREKDTESTFPFRLPPPPLYVRPPPSLLSVTYFARGSKSIEVFFACTVGLF
jgi:hypothetical protein